MAPLVVSAQGFGNMYGDFDMDIGPITSGLASLGGSLAFALLLGVAFLAARELHRGRHLFREYYIHRSVPAPTRVLIDPVWGIVLPIACTAVEFTMLIYALRTSDKKLTAPAAFALVTWIAAFIILYYPARHLLF